MDAEEFSVDLNPSIMDTFGENVLSETKLESLSKYDLLHLLKETKSQCTTFELANQKLQESVDNLEKALEEQRKRCKVLEEDKSFLRNNIKKASANWFERKAKLSESDTDTNGAEQTSLANERNPEVDDDESNKKAKKHCLSVAISEESVKLFSDLKFKEEQLELSERRCAELNKRVKEYEKVIDDQEIIIHGLEKQLETYFNDNQSMSRQLADLHRLFVDLEAINDKQVRTPDTSQEVESSSEHLPTAQEFKEMSGSVTKTYMKLKELIYEKKSLVTEIERLQTLNIELQNRVSQQETRLIRVSDALQTTWLLVSNLKDQHEQIHTSKTILRYELREKREILQHLKNELECSREQWHIIRQKNSEAEQEWTNLRNELNERRELKKLAEINGTQTLTPEEVENAIGGRKKSENEFEPPIDLLVDMGIEYGVVNADDEESDTVVALIDGEDVHEHRLQNLEEQCCFLYQKLMTSTSRALTLASRLSSLHQHYAMSDEDDEEDNEQEYDEEDEDDANLYESEMASPDSESYDTAYVSEGDGAESTSGTTETTVIINENDAELKEIPGDDEGDSDDNADSLSRRLITFLPKKIEILKAENKKLEEKLLVQQEEKGKIESALATAIEFERRQRRQLEEQLSHLGKCVDELKLERNGKIAIVEEKLRRKVEQVEKEEKEHIQLREEYEALKENFEQRGELLQLTGSQLEQTVKESEKRVEQLQEEIFNLKNRILMEELQNSKSTCGHTDGGGSPKSASNNEKEAERCSEDGFVSERTIAERASLLCPETVFRGSEEEVESHFKRMVISPNTRLGVPVRLPVNAVLCWSFALLSKEIRFSIFFTETDSGRKAASEIERVPSAPSAPTSEAAEWKTSSTVNRLDVDVSKELLGPHVIQSSSFPTTGRIFPRMPGTFSLVFQNTTAQTQEVFLKIWLEPPKGVTDSTGR